MNPTRAFVSVAVLAVVMHFAQQTRGQVTLLEPGCPDAPQGGTCRFVAVSGDGTRVVVESTVANRGPYVWEQGSGFLELIPPAGTSSEHVRHAVCISRNGNVVGGQVVRFGGSEAALWPLNGEGEALGDLPGDPTDSIVLALSADGQVAVGETHPAALVSRASLFVEETGWTSLGFFPGGITATSQATGVSASGAVICGWSQHPAGLVPFRWTASTGLRALRDPTDKPITGYAWSVSADGRYIVGEWARMGIQTAFRWSESFGVQDLGSLFVLSPFASARDVSADGRIVVGTSTGSTGFGTQEAFVWFENQGMIAVRQYLNDAGIDTSGWQALNEAVGISDDGTTIVGWGTRPSGRRDPFVIRLTVAPPIHCADASLDGVVNFIDITAILTNWGTSGPIGDANGDGSVTFPDITAVLTNWGRVCP